MKKRLFSLIFITLFLLSACSQVNKYTNEILSLINDEKYEEAKKEMLAVNKNKELTDEEKNNIALKVEKKSTKNIDKLVDEFKNDQITVAEFKKTIDGYKLLQLKPIIDYLEMLSLDGLIGSREAFTQGNNYLKDKKFAKALDEVSKVYKDDVKYEDSENLKIEAKGKLYDQLVNNISENTSSKDAFLYLIEHKKYFDDDKDFQSLLDKHNSSYYDEVFTIAKQLHTEKKYNDAIAEIELFSTHNELSEEIIQLKDEIITTQKVEKQNKIDQLLATMDIHYDSISDTTRVAPKGINPFTLKIPQGDNIFFPTIQYSGNDIKNTFLSNLIITIGFSQDDWVFFDSIHFNADGNRFEWDFGPFETETEVGWGGIYEWASVNTLLHGKLISELETLANATTVEFRYKGDTAWRDAVLTNKQKQQIKNAIELYKLLNE